jgi:hypothetical protein
MNEMNDDRGRELDDLKTKLMKENHFLKSLASKPLSVYFDAFRTKAYDGGGEENLTFQVSFKNQKDLIPKNPLNMQGHPQI